MADVLFLNPSKAAQMLMAGGLQQDAAFAHLTRLKNSEFATRFDGTTYFDPRELNRIIKKVSAPRP